MSRGWIGVDLDGTLAEYDSWKGAAHIGKPIEPMVARVRKWLAEDRDVRIFTARVSHNGTSDRIVEAEHARNAIEAWCLKHLGRILPVTNVKDYAMISLWDDRCVQVKPNTGLPVSAADAHD